MQGDVILAEPGAVIGFAGQRVIKQTIGQDLPEGFQTAEFLLEHGQIDDVVPRGSLRETTARLLRHMQGSDRIRRAKFTRGSAPDPGGAPAPRLFPGRGACTTGPDTRPFSQDVMAIATAYDDALEFLFPRITTIKFGLDTTRTLLAARGEPARDDPVDPRRRHQREGQRREPDRRGAGRGGMAGGTLHLAAPGVVPRADPGGRGCRSPRRRSRCGRRRSGRSSRRKAAPSSRPPPRSRSPTSPRGAPRSRWWRWGWAGGSTAPMSCGRW